MRSFKSTLVFASIVFLVVLWSFFDYKSKEREKNQKEVQGKIFRSFKKENIRKISFTGPKSFELEKNHRGQWKKGEWNLTHPIKDLASKNQVEDYIEKALKKKQKVLLKDHKSDQKILWADYGLEKPEFIFSLTQSIASPSKEAQHKKKKRDQKEKEASLDSEETISVAVSSIKSYDGNYFLRINNKNELSISDGSWAQFLSSDAENFREKRLFDPDLVAIEEFRFQRNKLKWDFKKEKDLWIYPKNLNLVIDHSYVEDLIRDIKNLKGDHFLTESSTKELEQKYQLKTPEFEITLMGNSAHMIDLMKDRQEKEEKEGKNNRKKEFSAYSWNLRLSPSKDKTLYAKASHRNFIGKVSSSKIENFPKKLADFRDKNHPFSFDLDSVFQFDLQSDKKNLRFKKEIFPPQEKEIQKEKKLKEKMENIQTAEKESIQWSLQSEKSSLFDVSVSQLKSFLRQISNLKVSDFLGKRVKTLSTKHHLKLKDQAGNLLLHLMWNKSFSKNNKEGKKEVYYFVRTNKLQDTVLLKKKELDEILDIQLIKEKSIEKKENDSTPSVLQKDKESKN